MILDPITKAIYPGQSLKLTLDSNPHLTEPGKLMYLLTATLTTRDSKEGPIRREDSVFTSAMTVEQAFLNLSEWLETHA